MDLVHHKLYVREMEEKYLVTEYAYQDGRRHKESVNKIKVVWQA